MLLCLLHVLLDGQLVFLRLSTMKGCFLFSLVEMNSTSMMCALYVGDLHPKGPEPMIKEKFSTAGCIHSVRLCRDRKTGSTLGYAFINFKHRTEGKHHTEHRRMLFFTLFLHFNASL